MGCPSGSPPPAGGRARYRRCDPQSARALAGRPPASEGQPPRRAEAARCPSPRLPLAVDRSRDLCRIDSGHCVARHSRHLYIYPAAFGFLQPFGRPRTARILPAQEGLMAPTASRESAAAGMIGCGQISTRSSTGGAAREARGVRFVATSPPTRRAPGLSGRRLPRCTPYRLSGRPRGGPVIITPPRPARRDATDAGAPGSTCWWRSPDHPWEKALALAESARCGPRVR